MIYVTPLDWNRVLLEDSHYQLFNHYHQNLKHTHYNDDPITISHGERHARPRQLERACLLDKSIVRLRLLPLTHQILANKLLTISDWIGAGG